MLRNFLIHQLKLIKMLSEVFYSVYMNTCSMIDVYEYCNNDAVLFMCVLCIYVAQPTVTKPIVTVAEASSRRSVFKWQKNGGVHKLKREYKIKDGALVKR